VLESVPNTKINGYRIAEIVFEAVDVGCSPGNRVEICHSNEFKKLKGYLAVMISSMVSDFENASEFASMPQLHRWLRRPGRYLSGLIQRYVLNNFARPISERSCFLFTGDEIQVPLPAGAIPRMSSSGY